MKKTAVVFILVLTFLLSACGKEETEKTEILTIPDVNYGDTVESFTFADYNYTISDYTESFTFSSEETTTELSLITTDVSTTNQDESETLTSSVAPIEPDNTQYPAGNDLSKILSLLELEQVATTEEDKQRQLISDEMMRAYFSYYGEGDLNYYSLGKCKVIGSSDAYADFIYISQIPNENGVENYYYAVSPDEGTIIASYVASEGFLVWKNNTPPDEEKAIAFFDSVMGDKYDYEYIDLAGNGEYMFEVCFDGEDWQYVYVNWECNKIYISTGDRGAVEIYPNDVESFFDNF